MKVSAMMKSGQELAVSLRLAETGQEIVFHLHRGEAWKKVTGYLGHVPFEGRLIFEMIERPESDDLDVRMRLCVPAGTGDLPALVTPNSDRAQLAAVARVKPAARTRTVEEVAHPQGDKGADPGAQQVWPGDEALAKRLDPPKPGEEAELEQKFKDGMKPIEPVDTSTTTPEDAPDPTTPPTPDEEEKRAEAGPKAQAFELGVPLQPPSEDPPKPGEEEQMARDAKKGRGGGRRY